MKKILYILLIVVVSSCDSEDANDCFQTAGTIIRQDINVSSFNRILVNRDVALVVRQGLDYSVTVETGENLINDVTVEVVGDQLVLTDNNTCNFVRDFGITKVYVTTPTLIEIRCSTQFEIISEGALNFENLHLISENFNAPDTFPIGDFHMQLNVENLRVTSNGLSFFYMSGVTENLNINFAAGDGRFEGESLVAQHVAVFQRGSNDMVVNPQQSIRGQILSTGNVIAVNEPPIVEVEEVFNGRLIFN